MKKSTREHLAEMALKIILLRVLSKLSIQQVANYLQISEKEYLQIENTGKISLCLLEKLCTLYFFTLEEFLNTPFNQIEPKLLIKI